MKVARTYTLKRRAENQAQTRQRIVEAAVELHGTVGPAQTTISMVAEKAGVQRHTFYAHFPTDHDLLLACSGLALERSPLPDPQGWRGIADPTKRLTAGLGEIYDWYQQNAGLTACVLRDAEHHDATRDIMALRFGPFFAAYQEILGAGLAARQQALLHLALGFSTWRSLVRESGLTRSAAVAAMVQAIGAE